MVGKEHPSVSGGVPALGRSRRRARQGLGPTSFPSQRLLLCGGNGTGRGETSDALAFIAEQRKPRYGHNVLPLEDREPGLSARTIKRRLATVSRSYAPTRTYSAEATPLLAPTRSGEGCLLGRKASVDHALCR